MPSRIPDEEIAERVEEDDGDPEDTVVIRRVTAGAGRRIYHADPTDEDDRCESVKRFATDLPERVTRREAQERGLGPCERCILDKPRGGDGGSKLYYQVAKHYDADKHDSLADAKAELEAGD